MEELYKKIRILEKMTQELDCICGLLYLLKDALWQNEETLCVHYSMASFYISEKLNDYNDRLSYLLEQLFEIYQTLPKNS